MNPGASSRWLFVDKAMLEYDKIHRKEWEEAGMTPPSFVKGNNVRK
jgi:hypothetical protein